MNKCFVIQPFDGGRFDKLFDDVFDKAIRNAQLDPYRVDRDPNVSTPIDQIESGINSSRACLAEITTDNPNVWFELGFAIAVRREVVLVCSDDRKGGFPFDIQHRKIIKYSRDSTSDFENLGSGITERLTAILKKEETLGHLKQQQLIAPIEGMEQFEIAMLVAVASQTIDPASGVSEHGIRDDMQQAGYAAIAATLGLRGVLNKRFVEKFEDQDSYGNTFGAFRPTESGIAWLLNNTDKLKLKAEPPPAWREMTAIPF